MSDEIELPDEVDESERQAWEAYVANVGVDYASGDEFRDSFCGEYRSLAEYAEELSTDVQEIPLWLEYYIDWELMARDWELSGEYWTERTTEGVYVFRSY
jgi:antirestriction protein